LGKVGFIGEDLKKNSRLEVYSEGCIGCVHVGDEMIGPLLFRKRKVRVCRRDHQGRLRSDSLQLGL